MVLFLRVKFSRFYVHSTILRALAYERHRGNKDCQATSNLVLSVFSAKAVDGVEGQPITSLVET